MHAEAPIRPVIMADAPVPITAPNSVVADVVSAMNVAHVAAAMESTVATESTMATMLGHRGTAARECQSRC